MYDFGEKGAIFMILSKIEWKINTADISYFVPLFRSGSSKHMQYHWILWNDATNEGKLFFVLPELSSVRDYVITHSVRSMYVVCM